MTVSAITTWEQITVSNQPAWKLWPEKGQSNKVLKMEKLKKNKWVAMCINFASFFTPDVFFWQTSYKA